MHCASPKSLKSASAPLWRSRREWTSLRTWEGGGELYLWWFIETYFLFQIIYSLIYFNQQWTKDAVSTYTFPIVYRWLVFCKPGDTDPDLVNWHLCGTWVPLGEATRVTCTPIVLNSINHLFSNSSKIKSSFELHNVKPIYSILIVIKWTQNLDWDTNQLNLIIN